MQMGSPAGSVRKARPADLWPVALGVVLVGAFFVTHQASSTGFFTSHFGLVEAILLYGAILSGLVPPLLGAMHLTKRSELSYLLITSVFWTAAAAWLYLAFPFDFSHITAVVPSFLSFLLSWITNSIGRIIVGVALVGAFAFIPFFALQFVKASRDHTLNLRS